MMKKLSVVIPMYNESENAPKTAKALSEYLFSKMEDDFEIVFCDDGRKDGCAEKVKELNLPNVRVVGYSDNRGKGGAVKEGIMNSNGDIIVYTDSDLAYGAQTVYKAYRAIVKSGANLVIGSRNLKKDGYEGYTLLRKLMSKAYIKTICLAAGFKYSDSQCGIKALTAESARTIFSYTTVNGFAFELEVLLLADRLGMKVREMPAKVINHDEGSSKVNPIKDTINMLRDIRQIKKRQKTLNF